MAVVDELVTLLGLEVSPGSKQAVATIQGGLEKITKFATIAGAALTAAAASIGFVVNNFSKQGAEIAKLSDATGLTTDSIQQLSFAADKAGVSSQSLIGDISNLTKSMHSPIPGEFNQGLFMLGISTRKASGELKSGADVLFDMADKFEGMSHTKAANWAAKVGISSDTLVLLKQGKGAIQDYMKQAQAFTVPAAAIEASRKFQILLSTTNRIFQYVGQTIAASLVPAFDKYIRTFTEFMLANKEFIELGLKTVVDGISKGFDLLWTSLSKVKELIFEYIPGLKEFTKGLIDSDNIANALLVSFGIVGVALGVMFAKFIAIGAAIAVVVVAFEDVITYFRGGESVTGRLIEKINELANSFTESFPGISELIKVVAGWLGRLASWTGGELLKGLAQFWQYLKEIGAEIVMVGKVFLFVFDQISKVLLSIPKTISGLAGAVAGMLDKIIPGDLRMLLGLDADDPDGKPQQIGSGSKYFEPGMPIDEMFNEPKPTAEATTRPMAKIQSEMSTAQVQPSVVNNNAAGNKTVNFSNTQNIHSNGNSLEVANESARMIRGLDMYPGEYAPVTQ